MWEGSRNSSRADAVLGDTRAMRESKAYAKWKSMVDRGLQRFVASHPQTFQRRLKRGVPQDFRWDVWKLQLKSKAAPFSRQQVRESEDPICGSARRSEAKSLDSEVNSAPPKKVSVSFRRRRKGSLSLESADDDPAGCSHLDPPPAPLEAGSAEPNSDSSDVCPISLAEYHALASTPSPFKNLIGIDIPRTFPEIPQFDSSAQAQLARILNAFANYRPLVGYCQGMNFVVGFLLLVSNCQEFEVFGASLILFSAYKVEGLFRENFPLLLEYVQAYEKVATSTMPALAAHFEKEGVLPPVYLHQWFLTLYVRVLPMRTVVVLWDYLLAEGLPALISVTVALLNVLQRFLLRLKFEDVVKFLKSLRSSGSCDETDIGRMLVQQASSLEVPADVLDPLIKVDVEALVQRVARSRTSPRPWVEAPANEADGSTSRRVPALEQELAAPVEAPMDIPNPLDECCVEAAAAAAAKSPCEYERKSSYCQDFPGSPELSTPPTSALSDEDDEGSKERPESPPLPKASSSASTAHQVPVGHKKSAHDSGIAGWFSLWGSYGGSLHGTGTRPSGHHPPRAGAWTSSSPPLSKSRSVTTQSPQPSHTKSTQSPTMLPPQLTLNHPQEQSHIMTPKRGPKAASGTKSQHYPHHHNNNERREMEEDRDDLLL